MEISYTNQNRELTIYLKGELDHHAAKQAMAAIDDQIEACLPSKAILDLKFVTFMDSSGIAVLLRAYRRMSELEGSLMVRNVPEQTRRVLNVAGLNRLISFC
ncbi:MAG: anti-sigma factor antagonist [Oscillospiraceae bacterium]|nr:anti-sigma factor antagonist [Oscillospiraceae bacterium]